MADDGFDFHTPARRETKQFEPPPWEREAFEELERKRAERDAQKAPADDVAATEALQGRPDELRQNEAVPAAVSGAAVAPGTAGQSAEQGDPDASGETALDEARVTEMLAELSAEEPSSYQGLWKAAIVSAIVLGAIGAVLIVWSMAAIVGARRFGAVGVTGGLILLLFGAGFVTGALWLTVRTLRQRGVL